MSLQQYQRMRRFRETPEPRGEVVRSTAKARRFVVQLHHASSRHYDFRLEVGGVLRSWAVPKGPSFRPGEKRLAVQVEDHPLSYASFEGEIPEGHYGAGHVAIFDDGRWTTEGDPAEALKRGKLDFRLQGDRLKGAWTLVRTGRDTAQPQWLLFKRSDEFSGDFEADDLLEGVRTPDAAKASSPNGKRRRTAVDDSTGVPMQRRRLIGQAAALPGARRARGRLDFLPPMLTRAAKRAPDGDEWVHEWKWDGYRLVAASGDAVRLWSRNGLSWDDRVPEIARALASLRVPALLDGELVAVDRQGHSDFNALQHALKTGSTAQLRYIVFDLMRLGDVDLTGVALRARKALLAKLLEGADPRLFYSEHVEGLGPAVFAEAGRRGMEGIISKRAEAPYRSGRSDAWLKVKAVETREFVVVGYTPPKGSRKGIGAFLLAQMKDGRLVYAGRVGSGIDATLLQALPERLAPLHATEPVVPLPAHTPLPAGKVQWVRPSLVVEVIFRGWGKEGLLRQASFLRLRDDRAVGPDLEQPGPVSRPRPEAGQGAAVRKGPARKTPAPRSDSGKKPSLQRDASRQTTTSSSLPKLTSPDRVVFPDIGATKKQVYDYYLEVADRLLEEIGGRLLSIVRCPNGIDGQRFFQKHAGPGFGDAVKRLRIREADGDEAEYFYVDDVAGLMTLVQMNAIEFHPWGSRIDDLEKPDRLVFDLDPDPAVPWSQVKRAAVEVRERLAAAGLPSYPRLTGGKGLHVVAPLAPDAEWDRARDFCEAFAQALAAERPGDYVATMSKAKREGRIFIDWLRNGRGNTSVAAWSLRARPGAPAAVLIDWGDLPRLRRPDRYSIRDAARLQVPRSTRRLIADAPSLPR